MNKKSFLCVVLLVLPLASMAAPGKTTKYLMEEPASLFDLGIIRARYDLNNPAILDAIQGAWGGEFDASAKPPIITVEYSYEDDLIRFGFSFFEEYALDKPWEDVEEKKLCSAVFDVLQPQVMMQIGSWFSHQGYAKSSQAITVVLQDRVEIYCYTRGLRGTLKLKDTEPSWQDLTAPST